MIRRDHRLHDTNGWLLITQPAHAHVSGLLAEHWGSDAVAALPQRDVLLPAIYRHDDGWYPWEERPNVDPESGHPRSFMEMPLAKAHELWASSIEGVVELGPLAPYVVAEHFIALRELGDSSDKPSTQRFIDRFEPQTRDWFAQWQSLDVFAHTLELAQQCVDYLQFFDRMSLWLCCRRPTQPLTLDSPNGVSLTWTPAPEFITVSPWPFDQVELEFQVGGEWVAQRQYADAEDLASAPRTAAEVSVRLMAVIPTQ